MKRFTVYFLSTSAFLTCLIVLAKIHIFLKENMLRTFEPMLYGIYMFVYPIIIGFIFALPYLINVWKERGKLKYDWVRALAMGIPTLFIGTGLIFLLFSSVGEFFPGLWIIYSPEVKLFGSMLL